MSRHRRLGLCLTIAAFVAVLGGSVVFSETAFARRIALGVYISDAGAHPARIDRYARLMGRQPTIVSYYKQWDFPPFVERELRGAWNRGAVPMVSWEPMSYHGRRYPLRAIVRGRYDRYLRRAARVAASWDRPLLVRFAHEMNGGWYPWALGVDGNTAGRYKSAWRRIVRIFRSRGADNVRWVWTPNVDPRGRLPFKRLYPGDAWVDWVGLDGFNWGHEGRSFSFGQIFNRSYRTLTRISRRPVLIAETGAYFAGKARWISQALKRQLPRLPRVKALVWYNHPTNGVDLRFNSSRPALRAFRSAARTPRYQMSRRRLLAVPARLGYSPRARGDRRR